MPFAIKNDVTHKKSLSEGTVQIRNVLDSNHGGCWATLAEICSKFPPVPKKKNFIAPVYVTTVPFQIISNPSFINHCTIHRCMLRARRPGIESCCSRDFSHPSRPALWPTQPPIQWVPGLFAGGKAAGAWC